MDELSQPDRPEPPHSVLPLLLVLAGASLVPALPVGALLGTNTPAFFASMILFGVLQSLAVIVSLGVVWRVVRSAGLPGTVGVPAALLLQLVVTAFALLPVTARDALIHHLAVAKWWAAAGRVFFIRWHEWSSYPMLSDMPMVGLCGHGYCDLSGVVPAAFFLPLVALIGLLTWRQTGSAVSGTVALFLGATLPMFLKLGSVPLADLPLAAYALVAVWYLMQWGEGRGAALGTAIGCGVALGLAASTKYNGLLYAAVFVLVGFAYMARERNSLLSAIFGSTVIGVVMMAVVAPWFAKNAMFTGNPVYPLFSQFFPTFLQSEPGAQSGLSPLMLRRTLYGESWTEIALIPLRMILFGQDDSPQRFDGELNPLLLLVVPSILLVRRSWARSWWMILVGYTALALVFSPARIRYLAPVIPLTVALAGAGFSILVRPVSPKGQRLIAAVFVLFFLGWGGVYLSKLDRELGASHYFFSSQTTADYLEKRVPGYPIAEYMNANLPGDSLTYLLFTGDRFYYYETPVQSAGYLSANHILRWVTEAQTPEVLLDAFKFRGFTHLLVRNQPLLETLRDTLTNDQKEIWNAFQSKYLEFLHQKEGFSLWRVRIEAAGESAPQPGAEPSGSIPQADPTP